MPDFPAFTKSPLNRIAAASQFTDDIEGHVFDGADGSRVAFWTSKADRISTEHVHEFDEHVIVVELRCRGERAAQLDTPSRKRSVSSAAKPSALREKSYGSRRFREDPDAALFAARLQTRVRTQPDATRLG